MNGICRESVRSREFSNAVKAAKSEVETINKKPFVHNNDALKRKKARSGSEK